MTELNSQSITFSEVQKDQVAYLDSKTDSNVWRDRYDHSSGTIELELNSVVSAHLLRKVLFERREAYLHEAKKLSSVIGIANNLGYSVKRPSNAKVRIKILPNQTITISKFQEIGLIKDVTLLAQDTITLISGVVTYVDCIIGLKKTATITAKSNELDLFRFIEQDVSNDIRLFITNNSITQEISFTEKILDLNNDKFVVITNPFTSIDLMYLNDISGQYYYDTGSVIELEYIESNDLDFELIMAQVTLYYGTFYPTVISPLSGDTQILSAYRPIEDILSVAINAPLYFESQGLIRGREDFRKNFAILGGGTLIDTNGRDISPAFVELTYVKSDKTLLTNIEKTNYLIELNKLTNYGVKINSMSDPVQVSYQLKLTLKQYLGTDISNVANSVNEIFEYRHKDNLPPFVDNRISRRESKLEYLLSLDQLEHEIVRIENERTRQVPIQVARVEIATTSKLSNTAYTRGQFVKLIPDNGFIYECMKSGITNPTIPNIDFPITENSLLIENLQSWQVGFNYVVGDYVKTLNTPSPYVFKCVQAGLSGGFEPSWNQSTSEDIATIDNSVLWRAYLPLDISGFLIWKCRNPNIRELEIQWNEYLDINYGTSIIWQ
jgi:hypothetical protein